MGAGSHCEGAGGSSAGHRQGDLRRQVSDPLGSLGGPGERSVVPVIALADQVKVEAETVDVRLLRPGERQATVGRMRRIVDIERVAAAVARRNALDLERQYVGDRGRTPEPVDVNLDRLELNPAEIANEMLTDERRRAAGFTPDDGGKRDALEGVGAVVDHARENPVAV